MTARKVLDYYWCVKVDKRISEDGEIYLYSDLIEIKDGNLIFKQKDIDGDDALIIFSIASDFWSCVFAASCIDGVPCHVEHWEGMV